MGRLGDFLEAVYGPADRFRTVRAVLHEWKDWDLAERASGGRYPVSGRRKAAAAPAGRRLSEADARVWLDGPTRVRVERAYRATGRAEQSSLTVVAGDRWWKRDHQGHVEVGEPSPEPDRRRCGPGLSDVERHFSRPDLREYFVGLDLTAVGPVRTAGRDGLHVRATPRPGGRLWPHWLPCGADEYEFHVDPGRAALLFIAGKYRGEVFETHEVRDVAFDEPLDPGLFTYEPARGEQVRPPDVIAEDMTLAAAAARMTFTVLVPARVPDGYGNPDVMYHPPRLGGGRPHLTLIYRGGASLWLDQADAPEDREGYEWEAVERGGRRMAISDPGPGAGDRLVRLEHLGTHVDIRSELDRDRLLDLAASLAPVSCGGG